jgi:ketosteroid isomerase-like protein
VKDFNILSGGISMSLRPWSMAVATAVIVTIGGVGMTVGSTVHSAEVGEAPASATSPAKIVEAAIAIVESGDLTQLNQLLTPDARFDIPFPLPNTPATFQGRDAIIARLTETLGSFERVEFTEERIFAAQDNRTVFVEAKGNFVVKGTGAPYKNMYVFAFEVHNGKITALREYNNPLIIAQTFNIPLSAPSQQP